MREIVDRFDPDLVIVMLGENDHQALQDVHGDREALIGTSEWPPAYRKRVLSDVAVRDLAGAKVVWAGLPISRDSDAGSIRRRQNDIFELAANIPNGRLLRHVGSVPRPRRWLHGVLPGGGRVILIRAGDGLHFNAIGTRPRARVAKLAAKEFGLSPRTFGPRRAARLPGIGTSGTLAIAASTSSWRNSTSGSRPFR